MKTVNNKQDCKATNSQAKTGFLSFLKTKNMFRLNDTNQPVTNQLNASFLEFANHERETRSYEIEAELRKASARTYANPSLIR